MNKTKYTKDEVYQASLKYFNNDELATNVFMTKYCLKDNDNNFLELTPDDMHHRLASEFARVEKNKFENTEIEPLTENEIFNLFKDFKYIIPQGSPMFAIGNNYQLASSSNCYVLTPPEDSYGSIMYVDEELVQISKRRGGVGIDLSKLRPKGAKTNNAAKTSTGIIAFMERYSNSIREVGQEGRRGALLLSLDCRHPEIKEFITVKKDLTKITGANISVKISDDFMQAVHSNSEFELCFPVDYKERGIKPLHTEKIKAKELWNLLIQTSHETAEPGILFWDHQLNYSPANCYDQYRPVSTNPCVVGDTLVLTNIGWIKIKNLQKYKDDYNHLKIITRDKDNVLTMSELEWVGITHNDSPLMKIEFDNSEMMLVTPEHKFYLKDYTEIQANEILIGDVVIGSSDRIVTNIENIDLKEDVWDLTANPNYNFYSILGHEEFIVPNKVKVKGLTLNELLNDLIIVETEHDYFEIYPIHSGKEIKYKFAYDVNPNNPNNHNNNYFENCLLSVDCAELALSPLESCRLISMNLTSYVRNPFSECARFDIELYHYHCMLAQRLSDDLIDIEDEIIDKIIAKIKNDPEDLKFKSREIEIWEAIKLAGTTGRRIGLGATGLADAIAMLNLSYSSDVSIKQIDEIFKTLRNATYESSVELSRVLGPFAGYDPEVEKDNLFLNQIKEEAPEIYNDMLKYGRRNVACNTLSPNGSISLIAGGLSSGVEPVFLLAYTRRRKLDSSSTETPDFVDPQGDRWINFQIEHNTVKKWKTVTGETDIKNSPWFGSTANDLEWNKRIEIQSTIQKYIDHSISSCVVKDTLLETNKGLLYFDELTNLDELEEGQFVKNTDSDILIRNKDDQFVPIDYFYKNGVKPVTKIQLKNNNQLICTDNESVLVYNEYINDLEWKMVKDLDVFDMVKISIGVN